MLQSDPFNRSRISTVVVAAVTTNLRLDDAPGNVLLEQSVSGLPRDSTINVSQILTLDKSFLTERVSVLPGGLLARVESGLRLVLGLLTTHPLDIIFIGRPNARTSKSALSVSHHTGARQRRHSPTLYTIHAFPSRRPIYPRCPDDFHRHFRRPHRSRECHPGRNR